jgi:eukaryotic-like serine/threonine-protein kinase
MPDAVGTGRPNRVLGRYVLYDKIASGGMATVHIGRLVGPVGFSRTVAIKRLHAHFADDIDVRAMFINEARLAAKIRHPNVVGTIDVVTAGDELFLVMEYVRGDSIANISRILRQRGETIPPAIVASIGLGLLQGLGAAHSAIDDTGNALDIVHRDVSPQNVLVGHDGVTRLVDFGIAKSVDRLQATREGQVKGKTAYMSPEHLRGQPVDHRTDIYGASVVLWEMLTGTLLFAGESTSEVMVRVLEKKVVPPSQLRSTVPRAVDAIVLRGLNRKQERRFASARDMAAAL